MPKLSESRKAAAPAKKAAAKKAAPAPSAEPGREPDDPNEGKTGTQILVEQGVLSADDPVVKEATKAAATAKKAPPKAPPKKEAKADPLDASVSLSEVQEKIKATYYGPQGSGKTSAVCTMANLSTAPTYVINAEGGLKKSALAKLGIEVDRIRILPDPTSGIELTFQYLEDIWLSAKSRLEADPESINGFIWDSVTDVHQVLLRNVVVSATERAEMKGKDRDPFFIDVADYGTMGGQVSVLLRRYRDLPCHFAMTALERRDKDKDGSVVYNPAVTPMLVGSVLGYPDIVAVTSVHEINGVEEYRGLFRPIDMWRGKDRFHALPKRLIDPTFERVAAYVYNDLDLESDPVMIEARERRAQMGPAQDREEHEPSGDEE